MPLPAIPTDFVAHWPGSISGGNLIDETSTYPLANNGVARGVGRVGESGEYVTGDYATAAGYVIPATGDWTFSTFIRVDSWNAANSARFAWQNDGSSGGRWAIYIKPDGLPLFWSVPTGSVVGTETITTGAYAHVAFARDGEFIKFYVNGIAAGSAALASSFALLQSAFNLGELIGNANHFSGALNRSKVYLYALTADQIKACALERPEIPTTDLVAAWDFVDMAAGVVPDSAPGATGASDAALTGTAPKAGTRAGIAAKTANVSSYFSGAISDSFAGGLTISGNYTFTSTATHVILFAKRTAGAGDFQFYFSSSGELILHRWSGSIPRVNWTPTVGVEYHIAFKSNGTSAAFFVDGVQVGASQSMSAISNNVSSYTIGWDFSSGYTVAIYGPLRLYDADLSLADIALLATERPAVPTLGLVNEWTGDNVTSGTTLVDEMGADNGVITGATSAAGKIGQALSFDGVNDFVRVTKTTDSVFSLSMLAKPARAANNGKHEVFAAHGVYSGGINHDHTAAGYAGAAATKRGSTWYATTPENKITDTANFSHILESASASEIAYFIEGAEVGTKAVSGSVDSEVGQDLLIGAGYPANSTTAGAFCAADIQRIRLYDRHLKDDPLDILALANESVPYSVAGNVLEDGAPVIRTVRVYDSSTGALLGETQSDAAGDYSLALDSGADVLVMALGGAGYRPLVHGPVTIN